MNLYIVYYHIWNVEIQYSDEIFQNFVLVRVRVSLTSTFRALWPGMSEKLGVFRNLRFFGMLVLGL